MPRNLESSSPSLLQMRRFRFTTSLTSVNSLDCDLEPWRDRRADYCLVLPQRCRAVGAPYFVVSCTRDDLEQLMREAKDAAKYDEPDSIVDAVRGLAEWILFIVHVDYLRK